MKRSSADACLLVDDEHLAVPLNTLTPGTTFKTPDWPEANIPGLHGVLESVGPCSCAVWIDVRAKAGMPDDDAAQEGETPKRRKQGGTYRKYTTIGGSTPAIVTGRETAA